MNNNLKREIPLILLVLIPFLYLGYIWNSLPDKVPVHWNGDGKINGWGSKSSLIIIPLLLPFLIYLILWIVPLIDPKKKLQNMGDKFYQLKFWLVLIMSLMALFILYSAKTQSLFGTDSSRILIGLLFTIIGNYMPSLKPNYFIGIRTPWTLENEIVWTKTHQLAGKLWFPAGLTIILLILTIRDRQLMHVIFLSITAVIALVPIVYSYIIFKRNQF